MANLILHVGPGKCGSSSIQDFFKSLKRPCKEKIRFVVLDPVKISKLNQEVADKIELAAFVKFLTKNLVRCDALVLSHEYLFDCPYAIKNICDIAYNMVSDITIIGYSRKQSDLIISVYSQWLFRTPDRVMENIDVLNDLKLDPILFNGLERHLIASISNDFYSARQLSNNSILDWHTSYKYIDHLVLNSGATVQCGLLPSKNSKKSHIQDFCEKSGLTLHKNKEEDSRYITNVSFNQDLIEAVTNAVIFGLKVPGPHECNKNFEIVSNKMRQGLKTNSDFLSDLKAYIDNYFFKSNTEFCKKYRFDKKYFSPSKLLNRRQIFDIINYENKTRAKDSTIVINNLRMLSAKMALTSLGLTQDPK